MNLSITRLDLSLLGHEGDMTLFVRLSMPDDFVLWIDEICFQ